MKKIYLAVFLACTMGGAAHAQISEGGIPWSMSLQNSVINSQNVARIELTAPDYARYQEEDRHDALTGASKPYRVAAKVITDIEVNKSGSWSYLEDGRKIWRLQISIPGALAVSFDYKNFKLPNGAKFYISNFNGKQVIGGYTQDNNTANGIFTTEMVQGNVLNLELDLDKGTDPASVNLNINRAWAYYRGVEYLNTYRDGSSIIIGRPTEFGDASDCEINAMCPQGEHYPNQRSAVAKLVIGGGWCSATLVNNTAGDCKPYLLSASHCEQENSFVEDGDVYATMKVIFEYQYPNCDGSGTPAPITRVGTTLKARSYYPSLPGGTEGSSRLVGDFLLLQLNETPPNGAYLAGWNRESFPPELITDPDKKYIGFHHPSGDAKKLCYGLGLDRTGTFNQDVVPSTHWFVAFDPEDGGGMEGGSSGSGMFDGEGRLIGDLSGGRNPDDGDCTNAFGAQMTRAGLYSKISYNWENVYDNTRDGYGPKFRLKDWLAPGGSTALTTDAVPFPCVPLSVEDVNVLENSTLVFPNPSTGIVSAKFNFAIPQNLQIGIYNVLGQKISTYSLKNVTANQFDFELSTLPNGIYLINIDNGSSAITKKVILSK